MNTLGSLFNDLCLFKFMSAMHYSFSAYQSYALWVKFSHNILLFYDIIIALFSSFTFWNVHFNRSTTDFYMSILYPSNLLNFFISYFMKYLEVFTCKIILSKNRDNFTTSLSIWKILFHFLA